MNLKEEFPSKWLKGDELPDNPITVTISKVSIEEFDSRERPGTKDRKVALNFKGKEKGMICNVGMRNIVIGFYGEETDDWVGKTIRIMAVPFTNDKGETSMVCRIHPKKPEAAKPGATAPTKPASAAPVDDIDMTSPEAPF